MAKQHGRKVKFKLTVGEDPSLWRFDNVQEALMANTSILSKLIGIGEEKSRNPQEQSDTTEIFVSESA